MGAIASTCTARNEYDGLFLLHTDDGYQLYTHVLNSINRAWVYS